MELLSDVRDWEELSVVLLEVVLLLLLVLPWDWDVKGLLRDDGLPVAVERTVAPLPSRRE